MDWGTMLFSIGLDILITVSAYLLVPTIFAIFRKKYKEKTILIISIVNCSVVWLIFQIIKIEQGGDPSASPAVFLWGGVGYAILRGCCLKKEASIVALENQQQEESTQVHLSLSEENVPTEEPQYGQFYGEDIVLVQENKTPEAVSPPPAPQPKVHRVQVQPVVKKTTEKNDSRSSVAYPETRQCKDDRKQNSKRISGRTVCIILLSACLIASAVGNVVFYASGNQLEKANTSLVAEIARLENNVNALKKSNEYYLNLSSKNNEKLDFYDKCVVFVEDDGLNLYHKYGCTKFAAKYFWVYNPENAVARGYKPCSRCID